MSIPLDSLQPGTAVVLPPGVKVVHLAEPEPEPAAEPERKPLVDLRAVTDLRRGEPEP